MKTFVSTSLACVAALLAANHAPAATLVNDTWLDGDRTDPAGYSEQGVDADLDNDIESRWFGNPGTGLVATAGHLTGTVGTGSANWTTYFTDTFANAVSLVTPGDTLRVTWVFTPSGINAGNASQGFRMAVFQTPDGSRRTTDGTPADAAFTGYAIFQNFAPTLQRSDDDNLDIMERNIASGNLLSSGGNWLKVAGGGTSGNEGFVAATEYTFVFTAERTALGELQLDASFSGGNIDNSGVLSASFLDATPNTFTFDSFALRPSSSTSAAETFDTTLFRVEFLAGVPEPSSVLLLLGGLGMAGVVYRLRRKA